MQVPYNFDTSSPQYQMIQQYSDANRASTNAHYAQMAAMLQQQQAQQQAQAEALAQQEHAQRLAILNNADAYMQQYTPISVDNSVVEQQAPGYMSQFVNRALPQTGAMLAGAGGAIADFVGADGTRDYLLEAANSLNTYAQENAPRQVADIRDIDSLSSFGTWAAETAVDLAPSILGTIASGGLGAVAGGSAAATSMLTNTLAKKAAEYAAKGLSKEAAEQAAKSFVKSRAAQAAALSYTGVQETGSAYIDNVASHGVDAASSGRAMLTGAASAAVTGLMGLEMPLIRAFTGVPVKEAVEQAVKGILSRGVAMGALREGGEEAFQQTLQALNATISDERIGQFTPEEGWQILNAAAAGAVLGAPAGALNQYKTNNSIRQQQAIAKQIEDAKKLEGASPANTDLNAAPDLLDPNDPNNITTPAQRAQIRLADITAKTDAAIEAFDTEVMARRQGLVNMISNATQTLSLYQDSPTVEILQMDVRKRKAEINKAKRELIDASTAVAKLDEEYEAKRQEVIDASLKESEKAYADMGAEAAIAQANQYYADPFIYDSLSQQGKQAIDYVTMQRNKFDEQSAMIRLRIQQTDAQLRSSKALSDIRVAKVLQQEKKILEKELADIDKASRRLSTAANNIRTMLSYPTKKFSPETLDAQIKSIQNTKLPTSITDADSLVDPATFSVFDGLTNIVNEEQQNFAQQMSDRLQAIQDSSLMSQNIAQPNQYPLRSVEQNQRPDFSPTWSSFTPLESTPDTFLGGVEGAMSPMSSFQNASDSFLQEVPFMQAAPTVQQGSIPVQGDMFYQQQPTVVPNTMPSRAQLALPQNATPVRTNGAIPMPLGQQDVQLQAQQALARQAYLAEQQGIQNTGIFPAQEASGTAIPMNAGQVRPAIPEQTTTSTSGRQQERGILRGTTNAARKVYSLLQSSLKQLQGLGRVTVVVDRVSDVPGLDVDATSYGAYDPRTNTLYLFGENIEAGARAFGNKNPSKNMKDIVARAIVHEGVSHFGLSVLLNPTERRAFLGAVQRAFKDDPRYQAIKQQYDSVYQGPDKELAIAEEFVSKLAEGKTAQQLLEGMPSGKEKGKLAQWLNSLQNLFRKVLQKIGVADVTEADIMAVLRMSAANLANNTTFAVQSSPLVEGAVSSLPPTSGLTNTEKAERALEDGSPLSTFRNVDRSKLAETLREQIDDALRPIERVMQSIKKAGGFLTERTNIYKLLENMPNAQFSDMKLFETTYMEPLYNAIINLVPQGTDASIAYAMLGDYVTAKASLERNQVKGTDVEGAVWNNEKSQKIIQDLQSPQMDIAYEAYQQMNEARLRIIEDNALLPKEQTDAWRALYEHYAPLKTWESIMKQDNPQWLSSEGRRQISNAARLDKIGANAAGTTGDIDNAVTHAIMQCFDVIALKHKVEIDRALLQLMEQNPSITDFFEVAEIYEPEKGLPVTRVLDSEGVVKFKKHKTASTLNPGKTVTLIGDGGKKIRVVMHDDGFRNAYTKDNVARLGSVLRAMANLRGKLSRLFTVYNPMFWARNPLRDVMTAMLSASDIAHQLQRLGIPVTSTIGRKILVEGFGKMWKSSSVTQAIYRAELANGVVDMSKLDASSKEYMQYYDAYQRYGGKTTYFSTGGYEQIMKDVVKNLQDRKPSTRKQAARAWIGNVGKHMEAISDALENQTRYIAFVEIVKMLKADGKNPDGSRMTDDAIYKRAANYASNLTVNFSRKGAAAPIFDSLYMFASANIAGNARLLQSMIRKNKETGEVDRNHLSKFFTLPVLAYMAQATLARGLMGEDEDGINKYDKIPEYVKASNIIIPMSDGTYLTIPVAYGLNIFWNLARNIVDGGYAAATGGVGPSLTDAMTSSVTAGFDNFTPMGSISSEGWTAFVPTIFRPLAQLSSNKNFAGNPIMPNSTHLVRGELPDSQKSWSTTGEGFKIIAEAMNSFTGGSTTRSGLVDVSPETLDHLINSYLGGFGRIASSMMNEVIKVQQGDFSVDDALKLPFVSAFVRTQQPSDTTGIFAKARTELQTQINTVEQAKVNPNLTTAERLEIIRDNQAGIRAERFLNRAQKQLNDLRSTEKALANNKKLTPEIRNKRLEQLEKRKQTIMQSVIKRSQELGVRF